MVSGFALGGFAKGYSDAQDKANERRKTEAAQQLAQQEALRKAASDALELGKTYATGIQSMYQNAPNPDAVPMKAVQAAQAQAESIAQSIEPFDAQTAQAIRSMASMATQTPTISQAETAKALGKTSGATAEAQVLNQQAGVPGAQPSATTQPPVGAPTPITPTGATPASATPNPQIASTPTPTVAPAQPDMSGVETVSPDDIASAQPLPMNQGVVDPTKLNPGDIYKGGPTGYGVWDGDNMIPVAPESNAAPDFSKNTQEPVTASDVLKMPDNKSFPPGIIKAIGEGDVPFPSLSRGTKNAALIDKVRSVYPNANADIYKLKSQWRAGPVYQSRRAFNQFANHVKEMTQAFNQMQDLVTQGKFRDINAVRNFYMQHGGGENPVRAFELARQAATEEITNAWAGKGSKSLEELKQWQDTFDAIDSPQTFYKTMGTAARLVLGAAKAQEDTYQSVTHQRASFLTPQARALMKGLSKKGEGGVRLPAFKLPQPDLRETETTAEDTGEGGEE